MRKEFYVIVFLAIILTSAFGLPFNPADSSTTLPQKKKVSPIITARVHTMGLFMYMGRVVNHNPAADLYFNYTTRNGWGVSVFKVVDVNDVHSFNNFAFAFVSKTFHLGERFIIAPYVGAGLEQQHGFANHGSDAMVQLLSSFRFNKKLSLEYIGIFNNIIFVPEHADWTNRFRLIYSNEHIDVTGFFWNNNGAIDNATYTSSGLSIFYNRVPLAKRLYLGAGITTLSTFQSSNVERVPKQTGIQFSTTLTFK